MRKAITAAVLSIAFVLGLSIAPSAAAPAPLVATIEFVGEARGGYEEPTTVHWVFSGKEGQYPRLNVLFTCWEPIEGFDVDNPGDWPVNGQGTPVGANIMWADFHFLHWDNLYPGEGDATTVPSGGGSTARWDSYPGDKQCGASLNDWQTRNLSSKPPRLHDVVYWNANDPRVP